MASYIHHAQLTPTNAANVLPTTTFQGCAKGLEGTANNNTEEAPIGAMYHALKPPNSHQLKKEDMSKPKPAPTAQIKRSLKLNTLKSGFNNLNHDACCTATLHHQAFLEK